MKAYVPSGTIRANRLTIGDKYDLSLEFLLTKGTTKTFIVEKDGAGFLISTAVEIEIPEKGEGYAGTKPDSEPAVSRRPGPARAARKKG